MAKKSTKAAAKKTEPTKKERRSAERRTKDEPVATNRRKVQRRRQIDPTTCERDYSQDEIEFMDAMDAYKRANGRMFPTCSEILEVVRGLGYVRTEKSADASTPNAGDAATALESPADLDNEHAALAVATIDSIDDNFAGELPSEEE